MSAFLVSDITMHVIVDAIGRHRRVFGDHVLVPADDSSLNKIGQDLFAMNQAALAARYGGDDCGPGYRFRKIVPAQPVQVFKSVQCLLYQCTEGDVLENPLYKELEAFMHEIAREIVFGLQAYQMAKWDLSSSNYATA